MGGFASNVQIDVKELEAFIASRGKSPGDISEELGRNRYYMRDVLSKGYMSQTAYRFFLSLYGLPEGSLMPKPAPVEKLFVVPEQDVRSPRQHPDGYWLNLKYSPSTVKVQLMFGGEVVIGGSSKIRGETELDFAQAVSYAAHMCYKFLEQRVIEEKENK